MEAKVKIKISSERYAECIDDNICGAIEDALLRSFDSALIDLTTLDYYERETLCDKARDFLQESGNEAMIRDTFIQIFERFGLNVEPDGSDY